MSKAKPVAKPKAAPPKPPERDIVGELVAFRLLRAKVASEVYRLMNSKGVTVGLLAQRLNTTDRQVREFLTGHGDMSVSDLADVCFVLGQSLDVRLTPEKPAVTYVTSTTA